jgi:deoxyribonuclease (pyrimidine dimer)
MTRVNLVPPSELSRQHLIAEYRELPRIFGLVRKAIERGEFPNDKRNPLAYTLGTGHCRFFYNKLGWLLERQYAIIFDMEWRGYQANIRPEGLINGIPLIWCGYYIPTEEALAINRARIKERSNVAA